MPGWNAFGQPWFAGEPTEAFDPLAPRRADTVTVSDTVSFARELALSDAVVLSDWCEPRGRELSDSVALADSITVLHAIGQWPAEEVVLADSTKLDREVTWNDTIAITDSPIVGFVLTVSLSDSVTLSDAHTISRDLGMAETVGLADSFSRVADQSKTIADAVSLDDNREVLEAGAVDQLIPPEDRVVLSDSIKIVAGPVRRVSQFPVEALVDPDPTARLSQAPIEAIIVGSPTARLSQAPIEVAVLGHPSARLSQFAVEVLVRPTTRGIVTQFPIEVIVGQPAFVPRITSVTEFP